MWWRKVDKEGSIDLSLGLLDPHSSLVLIPFLIGSVYEVLLVWLISDMHEGSKRDQGTVSFLRE